MKLQIVSLLIFLSIYIPFSKAQTVSSSQIKLQVDKLNSLGSVLYFAAHPDDENTKLIAWLANEKKYRTAYLSLTRGDGGQNLLGTEQGIDLGLIRTQELLAARKIDRGEQYFTSAFDFGFSKTHEETFSFWKKEETLREVVYLIRKLQPDVIINRFPPDIRAGHGHHQASAILAQEAYIAAADPKRFPEQLQHLKPWKAKRLVWNTANFGGMNNTAEDQLKVDIGGFNPLLGYSYGEISALSRSQHKSQGFGSASQRGHSIEYFDHVDGEKANQDLFEGITTDWSRLGEPLLTSNIEKQIHSLQKKFQPNQPDLLIPGLVGLQREVAKLKPSNWKTQKLQEINQLILACAGLHIEAISQKSTYVQNEEQPVTLEIISRSPKTPIRILSVNADEKAAQKLTNNKTLSIPLKMSFSNNTQPYWLHKDHSLGKFDVEEKDFGYPENPEQPSVSLLLDIAGLAIPVQRTVQFRTVDPVHGEVFEPLTVSPALTAALSSNNLLIQPGQKKTITIQLSNHSAKAQIGKLHFQQSDGLHIQPNNFDLQIPAGDTWTAQIEVSNPKNSPSSSIQLKWNNELLSGFRKISYDHIPSISWFPPVVLNVKALTINNPIKRIAYIPGAGDLIPASLENIGIQVDILQDQQINTANLAAYDAVLLGVRAYNVSKTIANWFPEVLKYVENGGVALVQYNVNSKMGINKLGPYPFQISRDRVTEENAAIKILQPNDPALNYPNKIGPADFEGWVQERGLYFANDIDPKYRTPLAMADVNEEDSKGSLLLANYGKGKFVYTSLAFFRQLPAGVPGAYRLFVNLLTKEEK